MSTKSRTNWRQRAIKAEQRIAELEKAAEEWKQLATVWRSQFHQLQDQMALTEAKHALAPTVEELKEEPNVSE